MREPLVISVCFYRLAYPSNTFFFSLSSLSSATELLLTTRYVLRYSSLTKDSKHTAFYTSAYKGCLPKIYRAYELYCLIRFGILWLRAIGNNRIVWYPVRHNLQFSFFCALWGEIKPIVMTKYLCALLLAVSCINIAAGDGLKCKSITIFVIIIIVVCRLELWNEFIKISPITSVDSQ